MTNSERAQRIFSRVAEMIKTRAINGGESPRFITGDAHNVFAPGSLARMEGVITSEEPPQGWIRIIMTPGIEYFITPDVIEGPKGIRDEKTALDAYSVAVSINSKLTQKPNLDKFKRAPVGEMI